MQDNSKKILVIDDDAGIRDVINLVLSDAGYEVIELDNGHYVLETVLTIQPDLILLDIMLGDKDGRDICKSLKDNPDTSRIPIIMISASHGVHTVHESCNANDYIAKPFDIDDLLNGVSKHSNLVSTN
jgi:DNA-binding response OmpR family regulator